MKITKIELKNFRAFYGEHKIDLGKKGRNLLIYGENGSGKSSLLKAIELFMDSHVQDIQFSQHRNFFVTDADSGYVKISMRASERDPETTYEWSYITRETHASIIIEASKTKGSLDYKSLLEIYYPRIKDSEVDLFDLLIKTILSNSINAALLISPSSALKVLVLDDVLIGLDMSNRLPIIDVIKDQFKDYQIFLMTYDKEWYDILKRHFLLGKLLNFM